jgi:ppGpp synthetase/RelA/SpoT-type nucleotidyltranferase
MLLWVLFEDCCSANDLKTIIDKIESSPEIKEQYPKLVEQLYSWLPSLYWQPPLNTNQRQMLVSKMNMKIGGECTNRCKELEQLQAQNTYDHSQMEALTTSLQSHLELMFPNCKIISRTKSEKSIQNKLKSIDYQGKQLCHVKDMIGARVLCQPDQLHDVASAIESLLPVYRKRNYLKDNDDRPMQLAASDIDFYGLNYLIECGNWSAEIQVAPAIMAPWNDIEHVMLYKPVTTPDNNLLHALSHVRDNALWTTFCSR